MVLAHINLAIINFKRGKRTARGENRDEEGNLTNGLKFPVSRPFYYELEFWKHICVFHIFRAVTEKFYSSCFRDKNYAREDWTKVRGKKGRP